MHDVAAIRAEFDRLAAVEHSGACSNTEIYFTWLVSQLPPRVERLAEVGCGGGALTARLAPIAGNVLAIDLSAAMLDLANARCASWPHVSFRQLDAHDWHAAPRSLDAIVSVATLHHLDAAVVLPRWRRRFDPEGPS